MRAELSTGQSRKYGIVGNPLNIFSLPKEERAKLLSGPKITIAFESTRRKVPTLAFMASSTRMYNLLQLKPKITEYCVRGKVDQKSITKLLDLFTTEKMLDVSEITLSVGNFVKDLLTYQACLSLGIYYAHTLPLLNALRAQVSSRALTYEEKNTLVNRIPSSDPLFKHLANTLCHRRFKKKIPDIVAFEKWLGKDARKALQTVMVEIDQEHKRRRAAVKARSGPWRKEEAGVDGKDEKKEE